MKTLGHLGGLANGRKRRAEAEARRGPPKPPPRTVHLFVLHADLTSPFLPDDVD